MCKVKYLPLAEQELTEIIEYLIKENGSSKYAVDFLDRLDQAMKRLERLLEVFTATTV